MSGAGLDIEALLDQTDKSAEKPNDTAQPKARDGKENDTATNGGSRSRRVSDDRRSRSPGSDRDRDRRRGQHEDRRRRSRSSQRERSRGRDRGYDGYNGGRHYRPRRSRSREDRYRDSRYSDYGRGRGNHGRGEERRRRVSPQRHATDPERSRCVVIVTSLPAMTKKEHLADWFSARVGKVVDADTVETSDKRCKGIGYVEFTTPEDAEKAIGLTGQRIHGQPMVVAPSEAERNRMVRVDPDSSDKPFNRIYFRNLHFEVQEAELERVFNSFGRIQELHLNKNPNDRRSKTSGYVQWADSQVVKRAYNGVQGHVIAGRKLTIGLGSEKFTSDTTRNILAQWPSDGEVSGGRARGGRSGRPRAGQGASSALEDVDAANGSLASHDSYNHMVEALHRASGGQSSTRTSMAPSRPEPARSVAVNQPNKSRCVVLGNAFNADDETAPDWVKTTQDELKEGCEEYGDILHISLDPNSEDGHVHIKFKTLEGGIRASQGLNGRFYNKRRITCSYVEETLYNTIFPSAAKAK